MKRCAELFRQRDRVGLIVSIKTPVGMEMVFLVRFSAVVGGQNYSLGQFTRSVAKIKPR